MKSEPVFAIYKGDEFIDVGTRYELMEHMGWKKSIVYLYTSEKYRSGKVTDRNNPYVVILLEGGEQNEKKSKKSGRRQHCGH